jgi:DNA-binding GntR family transcriptional regulator
LAELRTISQTTVELDWRLVPETRPLSLSEQIAERLSQEILAGTYQPGQRILEQHIAGRFEVSRGPVREALRLLEREGVIEILPRRGAQVTSLTVKEVTDIFDIRGALVGLCMVLAMERLEPGQWGQVKEWVERLGRLARENGGADEYLSISFRLSLFLGRSSGNERLYELLRSLSRQTVRYTALGLGTQARRRQSARTWRHLLKAVLAGNAAEAEVAARTLVKKSRDAAIRRLEAAGHAGT